MVPIFRRKRRPTDYVPVRFTVVSGHFHFDLYRDSVVAGDRILQAFIPLHPFVVFMEFLDAFGNAPSIVVWDAIEQLA